jgi:tRNA1(Val) A37 N6-methylase TrmN6
MITPQTTLDGLLNRRVFIEQPTQGYRVALDTVFLAAAVPAISGDNVLDMGSGVGGALLCLAYRIQGLLGIGIEIQSELYELLCQNIKRNPFALHLEAKQNDVTQLAADLHATFDHVLMNPPYHDEIRHDVSSDPVKRTANNDKDGDLQLWIRSAFLALKPSGTLTLIHRADRKQEILSLLEKSFGEVTIIHLLPKASHKAKRIIIRARKDAFFSVIDEKSIILHNDDGTYTDAANDILRNAKAL